MIGFVAASLLATVENGQRLPIPFRILLALRNTPTSPGYNESKPFRRRVHEMVFTNRVFVEVFPGIVGVWLTGNRNSGLRESPL